MFNSVRGHKHWKCALGVSVWGWPLFWQFFPQRLSGGGAGESPREKKGCNSPLGVLSQASLKDSWNLTGVYFKGWREVQTERQPWEGYTIWRNLGEGGFSGVHEVCHDTGFRKSLAILGAPCTCLTHGHPAYNQRSQTRKKTIPADFHRQLTLKELVC